MYRVRVGEHRLLCQPKGDIRRNSNPDYHLPVVGDRVDISRKKQKGRGGIEGLITKIHGRDNQFARAVPGRPDRKRIMAANLDRVFVVSSFQKPGLNWGMVDRYLVYCELHRIQPVIVLNKSDLAGDLKDYPLVDYYRELGYDLLTVSAKYDADLAAMLEYAGSGISLLTGSSGVGKSSLINALCPKALLTVGSVSDKDGLGKHTTTNSMLIPLGKNGYLADSPGIREFQPPPQPIEDVRFGFREFIQVQAHCPFSNCLHHKEPGCAVRAAVKEGRIHPQRYHSYVALIQEFQNFSADNPDLR